MLVRDAVVETLVERGIDTVFGIPGTQSLPLNEAVEGRDDVRYVTARHETAVPHMAWGYAEASGRPAATLVIPGPGDLNATNGLKNAYNDGTPLVHLSVETDPELRGGDAIHETPPETYDPLVKENVTVETPAAAAATLDEAVVTALTPPTGPVRVGIPRSFLAAEAEAAGGAGGAEPGDAPVPDEGRIARAVDLLAEADRPVVVAGGGVRLAGANDALRAVAERLDAPVVTSPRAKGEFPEDHPLAAGVLSVGTSRNLRDLLDGADAALAVGTDLDAVATGTFDLPLPDRLVHVTLDPADLGQGYEPAVGIVADAAATLDALDERLPARMDPDARDRVERVREADADLMADVLAVDEPPLTSASAEAAVAEALPEDAVVSVDAGGFRIWSMHVLDVTRPRSYVDTGSWATMGTGLPAAIGAKVAEPDRPSVALTGDGGLLMCVHELHTVADEGIPVVVVALNNDDYATISWRASAEYAFDDGAFGWPETSASLVNLAESLGVRGVFAETPAEVREATAAALERDGPTLIEVPVDPAEPQAKPLD
ncbi:MAG: thiamine pyrophosphate-binding protein [Haloferacaceae archaeon]